MNRVFENSPRKVQAVCEHCHRKFLGWRKSKLRFCSYKCRDLARGWHDQMIEGEVLILTKYDEGCTVNSIARDIGISKEPVLKILKSLNVFSPFRPQRTKGYLKGYDRRGRQCRPSELVLLRNAFKSEQSWLRKQENHWGNHPELMRWYVSQKEKSHRVRRTNYFIAKVLRTRIYRVLGGRLKSAPTLRLLGCSLDFLKSHLQSQFKPGMNWNNYGKVWHIDHKEPCASFDLSKPENQRRCFHFSNLQPMFAKENLSKHARVIPTQRELLLSW